MKPRSRRPPMSPPGGPIVYGLPSQSIVDAQMKSGVKRKTATSSRPSYKDALMNSAAKTITVPPSRPRIMDAPTKSVAKNRKSKSKKRTGSSSRPRQLTPQKNWARGLEMYNWLPESLLKKGGWMSHEEFSKYVKKATESKGFDVSGCTGRITNGIGEVRGEKLKAEAAEAANYAVAEHNTKTGANLNFVGMVKSNFTLAAVTVFYITLSALDEQNQPRVFHAKVLKDGRPGTTPEKKYTMRSFQPAPGQEVNG